MMKNESNKIIFSIVKKSENVAKYTFLSFLCKPLEYLLSLRRCSRIFATLPSEKDPVFFLPNVLNTLNVRSSLSPDDRANIPGKNAAVVIANHPFGAIEGIVLADLLPNVRRDVKILANFILHRIPQLQEMLIPVDLFNSKKAVRVNIGPIRNAIQWLQDGGMLLVFPAGEIYSSDFFFHIRHIRHFGCKTQIINHKQINT